MPSAKSIAREVFQNYVGRRDRQAAIVFDASTADSPGSEAFSGLTPYSLSVASARRSGGVSPSVIVVLPELSFGALFAGVRTAIEFGASLSRKLDLDLTIVYLQGSLSASEKSRIERYVRTEFSIDDGVQVEILVSLTLPSFRFSPNAVWVGTHWTTAHALDVAARLGVISRERVVYLVQDYEPGFLPWSSQSVLARATYAAGFRLAVNSRPVAEYLKTHEGIDVPEEFVFRPSLDMDRLSRAAARRASTAPEGPVKLLFYARPNKPRNLFAIGMTSMHLAMARINGGLDVRVASMGDVHAVPSRGPLSQMTVLGKLSWDGYFDQLSSADVVLSLQQSPHPSHPPLDAVVSGGRAVTNDLEATRGSIHPRLMAAADSTPDSLADALIAALSRAQKEPRGGEFTPETTEGLGRALDLVVSSTAEAMSSAV